MVQTADDKHAKSVSGRTISGYDKKFALDDDGKIILSPTSPLGEVQTNPTTNTLLDRIKALLTGIVLAAGTNIIGKISHDIGGTAHGVKTVTTAGTHVALSTSLAAKLVIVQAQTDNTGLIAVGGDEVDATEATGTGIILYAGDTVTCPIDNLGDIYIDATVSGEGVRYTYFTA